MLFNSEVWYGLNKIQVNKLNEVDKLLFRRILEVPDSTPITSFYLEFGTVPIEYIIKARRIIFLHYILTSKTEEMLYLFYQAQKNYPAKNDWSITVKEDLEFFDINLNEESIKIIKKKTFSKIVKKKLKIKVFKDLMEKKEKSLSKLDNLEYKEFKVQNYLRSTELNVNQIKSLFRYRTRMTNVATNFSHSYADLSCPLCRSSSDTQEHLLSCSTLKNEVPDLKLLSKNLYKDIFSNNISKMKKAIILLDIAMKKREELLDNKRKEIIADE